MEISDLRDLLYMRAFSAVRCRRREFCLASTVKGVAAGTTLIRGLAAAGREHSAGAGRQGTTHGHTWPGPPAAAGQAAPSGAQGAHVLLAASLSCMMECSPRSCLPPTADLKVSAGMGLGRSCMLENWLHRPCMVWLALRG